MRLTDEERKELERALRAQSRVDRVVPFGFSYDPDFIRSNRIEARCAGCGYPWTGRDAIGAPTLRNCSCFWCHGRLVALDPEAYAARVAGLRLHRLPLQRAFEFAGEAR